jgi:hypothetical protein
VIAGARQRFIPVALLVFLLAFQVSVRASADAPAPSISAGAHGNQFSAVGHARDEPLVSGGNGTPVVVTRVNDCGAPPAIGHVIRDFTDPCAAATNQCAGRP